MVFFLTSVLLACCFSMWVCGDPIDVEFKGNLSSLMDSILMEIGGMSEQIVNLEKAVRSRETLAISKSPPVPCRTVNVLQDKKISGVHCTVRGGGLSKGSCYTFGETTANWNDARQACLHWGLDLVKIDDDEEYYTIKSLLKNATNHDTWVGLTDLEDEHTYRWSIDGSIHIPEDHPN